MENKKAYIKTIVRNKSARFHYELQSEFEAGIVLAGTEVKSIKQGHVRLNDSYIILKNNELFITNMHVRPYGFSYHDNHEPMRQRKLLMHKREIKKIAAKVNEKGFSIVPLSMYLKNNKIKLKIAIAKGKKLYDKRESIKEKEAKIAIDRVNKNNYR